jgi:hypothetical protein
MGCFNGAILVDGEKHFVCSSKAAVASSKGAAGAEPPPPGAATAQEYGASGLALILLLAHWSDSASQVLPENNKVARELLRLFAERTFERSVSQVSFNISQTDFMLYFREGKCKLGIVGGADNACAQALATLDLVDTDVRCMGLSCSCTSSVPSLGRPTIMCNSAYMGPCFFRCLRISHFGGGHGARGLAGH